MMLNQSIVVSALKLIPSARRKQGVLLVAALVLITLLELLSIGSMFSFVILLLQPAHSNASEFYQYLTVDSGDRKFFMLSCLIALLLLLVLKTAIVSNVTLKKASYAYSVAKELATQAMADLYRISYLKFTNLNYTYEMNRISNIPITFANNFIIPLGTILAELLIVTALLVTIAIVDVKSFVFLALTILPVAFLFKLQRMKATQMSNEIKTSYPMLLKITLEAIEGMPEVRTYRKEEFFTKKFNSAFNKMGNLFAKDHTVNTSTARLTELIAGGSICSLIIYIVLSAKNELETVTLLTLYAAITIRIVPSVNRIFTAYMQMRRNLYVVDELKDITSRSTSTTKDGNRSSFQSTIVFQNIHFSFVDQVHIFKGMSLSITKGEKLVITGRSGSGKTTLLLLMMGYIKPNRGTIIVNGEILPDTQSLNLETVIGYVPQNPYILDGSIAENIAFGIPPNQISDEKISGVMKKLLLAEWIDGLPLKTKTVIGEKGVKISGGQRQRIALARALYHNAELLLLDEVTSQLDAQSEEEVKAIISGTAFDNVTIVLITHRVDNWSTFGTHYHLENGNFTKVSDRVSEGISL